MTQTPDDNDMEGLSSAMAKLQASADQSMSGASSSRPPPSAASSKEKGGTVTTDSFSYQLGDQDDSISTRTHSSFNARSNVTPKESKYVEWEDSFLHKPRDIEETSPLVERKSGATKHWERCFPTVDACHDGGQQGSFLQPR